MTSSPAFARQPEGHGCIERFFRFCVLLALPATLAAQGTAGSKPSPLVIEAQGSFFVNGRDVHSDTLSSAPDRSPVGTVTVDQVYVHFQIPAGATGSPITLIHGCCLTGKTWETTPDGRIGWDEYFVRKGHPTYVIDQASRGRSATSTAAINSVKLGKTTPDRLPTLFATTHEEAWTIFRFGPEYAKTFPGMQFPLDAQAELWKQMVPDWIQALPTPNPTVPALVELAERVHGTVLVSHSQSGIYPFQAAALKTTGILAIVSIEPGACPDAGSSMQPYKGMPFLVLFGDYTAASPRWAPRVKTCRAFVEAANKAGARGELVLLPDVGIRGNSHMLMQDRNSVEVADWLLGWVDRHVRPGR